jgi:Ni,Fe-hydrogenase III small subunit/formate hydrogenlyase subunit 6/NADH:ubiquinone oxidoreductase subunit I
MPLDVFDRLLRPLRKGPVTSRYPKRPPELPSAARGLPELDAARCDGTAACVEICPTGAIRLAEPGAGWSIDPGACIFCGACARACPRDAIVVGHQIELATRAPRAGETPEAELLRRAIARRFGGSLHVRHLDAGSCNGCDWEMAALLNPYHDVQRLGIDFVASPRHADLLLVTGTMTRNLEEAARRTYEAMPEPRLVVAVGACAIGGGVFAGSYAGRDGIREVLPIDVLIPGCPPRPEALIHGLFLAVGRAAPWERR